VKEPVVVDDVDNAAAVDEVSVSNDELLLEDLVLQVLPCVGWKINKKYIRVRVTLNTFILCFREIFANAIDH
jgi:hypothetical protein